MPLKKWKPKKWKPEYDRIVAYSVMGKSNIWIAQNLQFTPEHVSTILHQPEALNLADKLHAKLRERIEQNIPETLEYVAQKTASRLKEMIDDDALFEKNPFAVIDRGVDVLKGMRHLGTGGNGSPGESGSINIGTQINIAPGLKSDIMQGLDKVAEVKRLHGNSNPESNGAEK